VRLERVVFAVALLVALLASRRLAAAEPPPPPRAPLVFVGDPKLGMEGTVRTFDSVGRLAFRYEDALPPMNLGSGVFARVLGFIGRGLEFVFVDEPLAELVTVGSHEVGGHGARSRELGTRPSYAFALPGIYRPLFSAKRDDFEFAGLTSYGTTRPIEGTQRILGSAGGIESDYVFAWWINARIVRSQGWAHHGDLLVYALSKVSYIDSFLSSSLTTRGEQSPNDVASYVTELQNLSNGWRPSDRERIAHRLQAGYLWNLVDPTLLYAIWGTGLKVIKGDRTSRMPLPTIGDKTLLLSPRFNLSPFGAEQMLDVMVADREGRFLDVYARVGTSGLTSYWGGGVRALGFRVHDRVALGGELDVWRQPELLLEDRGVFDPPQRVGMNAAAYGDVKLTKELGITGKLGAKTPGYTMGLPVAGGLHGYIGLSLAMF
jgi:hypothetical protein